MISKQHEVLFIHIPKCAGQAVETFFLEDLLLSWKTRAELLLRPKKCDELGPARLAHLYAFEYVKFNYISTNEFDQYFKFAIMRDPIDRAISELNFQKVKQGRGGFSCIQHYFEFILDQYDNYHDRVRHLEPQVNYIFNEDKSRLLLDKVIPFENLSSEWFELPIQFFIKQATALRMVNSSIKKPWNKMTISRSDIIFLKKFYRDDIAYRNQNLAHTKSIEL